MIELMQEVEELVKAELNRANKEFPLFRNIHEAMAVTEEEVYETSEEMKSLADTFGHVKKSIFNDCYDYALTGKLELDAVRLACEAIQVAAMARKFNMREEAENE